MDWTPSVVETTSKSESSVNAVLMVRSAVHPSAEAGAATKRPSTSPKALAADLILLPLWQDASKHLISSTGSDSQCVVSAGSISVVVLCRRGSGWRACSAARDAFRLHAGTHSRLAPNRIEL